MTHPGLLHTARFLGRARYVELALFTHLGRAACQPTSSGPSLSPSVATYLSGASLAHAWRARLLEDHLPVSVGLPGPEQLTLSPGPHLDAALDLLVDLLARLAAPPDPRGPQEAGPKEGGRDDSDPRDVIGPAALEALVVVLYPALLADYERRLSIARPASDRALARTLGRVVHDLSALLEEGRNLGATLIGEPAGSGGGGANRQGSLVEDMRRALGGQSILAPTGGYDPMGHHA